MTGDSVGGVDAKDGALLWKYDRKGPTAAIPTPVVSDDYVFVTSGYGAGCNLIKVTNDGGKFKATEVYSDKDMTNHHGGVVLVDGDIYGYSDGGHGKGRLGVQGDEDGQSPVAEGEGRKQIGQRLSHLRRRLSVLLQRGQGNGRAGQGHAGRLDGDRAIRAAREEQGHGEKGGKFWTHPVVANGRLYIRDEDLIFCYDVKGGTASR